MGFTVAATGGTADFLIEKGVEVEKVHKVHEGQRPHVVDHIKNGVFSLVINTPSGKKTVGDAKMIRQNTLLYNIPYTTTVAGARAVVQAIHELRETGLKVESLQNYYGE
jgi:carbamoyl-phosphate synthase large subunit